MDLPREPNRLSPARRAPLKRWGISYTSRRASWCRWYATEAGRDRAFEIVVGRCRMPRGVRIVKVER